MKKYPCIGGTFKIGGTNFGFVPPILNGSPITPVFVASPVDSFTRLEYIFFCKVVYYESMKRKVKIKPIYECRCNGRLQTKRFTRLSHTGLVVELEHLKIKTRLTNEKLASVKGECEI